MRYFTWKLELVSNILWLIVDIKGDGPSADPCGTPKRNSVQLLKLVLVFVLCLKGNFLSVYKTLSWNHKHSIWLLGYHYLSYQKLWRDPYAYPFLSNIAFHFFFNKEKKPFLCTKILPIFNQVWWYELINIFTYLLMHYSLW